MSNLTAHAWSVEAVAHLRAVEQQCADEDLFCVGYLIPQVELVELKYADQCVAVDQWREWLFEFVHKNIATDKLQSDDVQCIKKLIAEL
jgi:hypothetical protein